MSEPEENDKMHVEDAVEREIECFERVLEKLSVYVTQKIEKSQPTVDQAVVLLNEPSDEIEFKTACMLMQCLLTMYKVNPVEWLDTLLNSRDDGWKYKVKVVRARQSGIISP